MANPTAISRISTEEKYQRIFEMLSTQSEKNEFHAIAGSKAIEKLAASESKTMGSFATSVMKDIQLAIDDSTKSGTKVALDQLKHLDSLVDRFDQSLMIDKKELAILKKASKLGKGSLAAQRGNKDEEYFKTTALSDMTYSLGKALRDVHDLKGVVAKVGGLASKGKKRLLGGEESMFSARGMLNITKRMAGLGAMTAGLVMESPALMMLGTAIQDKVNKGDELISEREAFAKKLEKERIFDEMKAKEEIADDTGDAIGEKVKESSGFSPEEMKQNTANPNIGGDTEAFFDLMLDILPKTDRVIAILEEMKLQDSAFYANASEMANDSSLARIDPELATAPVKGAVSAPAVPEGEGFMEGIMKTAIGTAIGGTIAGAAVSAAMLLGAEAVGLAIGVAAGKGINKILEYFFGPEGIGGKLFSLMHKDQSDVQKENADIIISAIDMSPDQITAEQEKIKAEIEDKKKSSDMLRTVIDAGIRATAATPLGGFAFANEALKKIGMSPMDLEKGIDSGYLAEKNYTLATLERQKQEKLRLKASGMVQPNLDLNQAGTINELKKNVDAVDASNTGLYKKFDKSKNTKNIMVAPSSNSTNIVGGAPQQGKGSITVINNGNSRGPGNNPPHN